MPLTHAERQRRYRERIKERFSAEELREKESRRRKSKRLENPEEVRAKDRARQQKHRARKRGAGAASGSPPYKSASTLGKAVKRAVAALPKSPRKRSKVVQKLFHYADIECHSPEKLKSGRPSINHEIVKCVTDFYKRDDISRQAPGKRDTVTVHINGVKQKYQKRHLCMTLRELYRLFIQEYPELCIEKSKFAELRPGHVLLSSEMPTNVCVCRHHENFILLCEALHKISNNFPLYSHELPELLVCSESADVCWNNNCSVCQDGQKFEKEFPLIECDKEISWCQWEKVVLSIGKERLQKVTHTGNVTDVYNNLKSMVPSFLLHYFIKQKQVKASHS